MRTSYSKKIYLLLTIIFVIGTICGFLLLRYTNNSYSIQVIEKCSYYLNNVSNNYYFIIEHIIILSIILVLSLLIIGLPLALLYSFYNGVSCGFIINVLFRIAGFKGILYSFIYIIFTKLIYIVLLIIFLKVIIKISISTTTYFFKKNKNAIININNYYKKALIIFILIIINDILVYLYIHNVLSIFQFLI